MINVHIHHRVKEFHVWKQAFDAAFDFRKQAGEESFRVYQDINDPEDLTLWFEWTNAEAAYKFLKSEELARRMQQAGVEGKPHFHVLHEYHAMRKTAAD